MVWGCVCVWGARGSALSEEEKKMQRLVHQRTTPSGIHSGSGLSFLGSSPRRGTGFCQGRLPAVLPSAAAHEQRQEAGPSDTYLTEADAEESVWDAFTSPSGGAQQEPTEPAALKSDFHTSSNPRICLTPLAGGNRALSKCASGVWREFWKT